MTLELPLAVLLFAALQAAPASRRAEDSSPSVDRRGRQYAEAFPDLFLPYFEHTKKSLTEWMAKVRRTESADALWCVFYKSDRSAKVVDLVKEMSSKFSDSPVRRAANAIL